MASSVRHGGSWEPLQLDAVRHGNSWVTPEHAWVRHENGWVQVDVPTRISGQDTSTCLNEGTQFESPDYSVEIEWDELHFGNVTHVEIHRDGSEDFTITPGTSGTRSSFTDNDPPLFGEPPDTITYEVRYQFDDGSHSPFASVGVTINDPCA